MKTSAKIRTRKIKGGVSFSFSLVNNYRNPMSGTPTNRTVAYFGSVQESEISAKASSWWKEVDAKLDKLVSENTVGVNDAASAKRKFERVIPRPPVPKVTASSSIDDIRAALKARGITI